MAVLHILRVFTDAGGQHGNPLGVFVEEQSIEATQHQAIAAALGFSETVFVEDAVSGTLRLYTPRAELPFAGHPLVGTAWLLADKLGLDAAGRDQPRNGHPVHDESRRLAQFEGRRGHLRPPAGTVAVWTQEGLTWVRGRTEWCPSWSHIRAESLEEVESAAEAPVGHDHIQLWAFVDEANGVVRARVFAPRFGVIQDEACGSASMILAAMLNRPLTIRHGQGSVIFARPVTDGHVDLGGRVRLVETRRLSAGALAEWVDRGARILANNSEDESLRVPTQTTPSSE